MENVIYGNTYTATLSLDSDPDGQTATVSLFHDWENKEVLSAQGATRTAVGEYEYNFDSDDLASSGIHKIVWSYTVSGTAKTKIQYINVYRQYIDAITFFARHPETESSFDEDFDQLERTARNIIDTMCGQEFQVIYNNYKVFDGNDRDSLYLGQRLDSIDLITYNGEDYTAYIEFDPHSKSHIRFAKSVEEVARKFSSSYTVEVSGTWGWPYIPENIEKAAELLILDLMNADRDNHRYGIIAAWAENQRFEFKESLTYNTTGNIDVDVLLMDYTVFVLDYVV